MTSLNSLPKSGIIGISVALVCALAQAAPATFLATQAPKATLSDTTPPVLNAVMSERLGAFNSAITVLGQNEYELGTAAGPGTFSYTGGVATLTGGTVVGPQQSSASLGRYNMSDVPINPINGKPGGGHWLEGTADFTYSFSTAITALGFYGTDFGDLKGSFELDLYMGTTMIYAELGIKNDGVNKGNGNLLFYGIASDVAFDRAVFKVTQASGAGTSTPLDVLGFDSLVVGTVNAPNPGGDMPEPSSMALVGLALAAAGFATRRTRQG